MPLIVPPALKFPLPVIKPLRTPTEIQEVTGKAVGWKTSEFRLVYKGYELREFSKALASGLTHLSARHGLGEVRGDGLLWALELGADTAPEVVRQCRQQGLLVNAARPHCLRLMPRLNSTPEEVQEGLAILGRVMAAL